jgi:hypothetical protein
LGKKKSSASIQSVARLSNDMGQTKYRRAQGKDV